MTKKLVKTDAEWLAQLTSEQYRVTRQAGTEPPFSGEFLNVSTDGTFTCICCGAPLFTTTGKYESGCGWPSFWQAINPHAVTTKPDTSHGMVRVEINCAQCDAHLGHVFNDGPQPTGERYCVNSVSLAFLPTE